MTGRILKAADIELDIKTAMPPLVFEIKTQKPLPTQ